MLTRPTAILHQSCVGRREYVGACRFFNNEKVEYKFIGKALAQQTAETAAGKAVLVLQDTSTFNFDTGYVNENDDDLGAIGANGGLGFFVHPSIVIEAETGSLLGASDLYIWSRDKDQENKYQRRYQEQPLSEKESYRWIAAAARSKEVLAKAASIVFIADRESDIYEEFALIPDDRCHVLIRSKQNRLLYKSDMRLYETIASQKEAGRINIEIREAKKRQARKAELSIRFCKVKIAKPKNHAFKDSIPEYIELYAVEAKEKSSAKDQKPISWVILTTIPINNLSEALKIIAYYAQRWQIELVFGTMKTNGLNVEESELESGRALKSLAAMAFITALRINQLRLGREDINHSARVIFTSEQIALLHSLVTRLEGKTKTQKNPYPKESLAWGVWAIARLGGWKGYSKSESPPGNKTMHTGWNTFNQILFGWSIN